MFLTFQIWPKIEETIKSIVGEMVKDIKDKLAVENANKVFTCKAGFKGTNCQAACGCDTTGSIGTECDQFSGQCSCNTGYIDITCNSCATNYYRTSSGACKG